MTRKNISITSALLIALSLPTARAAVKSDGRVSVEDLANEVHARNTLKQVQMSANMAADEADRLRTIAESRLSPESQIAELTALRGEVNRMGREISALEAERESLAPWEQLAIDQVLPLFEATAANTGYAIEYFSENRDRLWTETYRGYVGRVWEDSEQIATTLKNYLKYDKLLDQQQQVEERIWTDADRNAE